MSEVWICTSRVSSSDDIMLYSDN